MDSGSITPAYFYSLAELNTAIRQLLGHLNTRLLRRVKQSAEEILMTAGTMNPDLIAVGAKGLTAIESFC